MVRYETIVVGGGQIIGVAACHCWSCKFHRDWKLLKGFMKENNMTDLYKFGGLNYDIGLNWFFEFFLQLLKSKYYPKKQWTWVTMNATMIFKNNIPCDSKEVPLLPFWGGIREGLVKSQDFHHCPVVMRPPPLQCQCRPYGVL